MTTILQVEKNDLQEIIRDCVRQAVNEMQEARPVPQPLSDRIGTEDVKEMTGQGDSWVYKKTYKGCPDPLPCEKFGKKLIFSRKAVQQYIDSHTKPVISAGEVMDDRLSKIAKRHLKK